MDAAERVRALHVPHSFGSTDCATRCEAPHPGVQVCNADDYRWPCPTIQALGEDAAECGYAWFHETAFGRDLVTCNLAVGHDGKHVRVGD